MDFMHEFLDGADHELPIYMCAIGAVDGIEALLIVGAEESVGCVCTSAWFGWGGAVAAGAV
jgi:hypothetical protein